MASFMSSIVANYRTFGVALLEAKDKNPKLDLDEFMKSFFGGEIAHAPVKVTQKKVTSEKKSTKNTCTATTAKGTQCTKCSVGTGPFCTIHLKKSEGNSKTKPKKETKKVPVHNHNPGEKDGKCELCEVNGDVMNPDDAREFEEVTSNKGDPDYVLEEEEFDED
jgi:hypothetical protein